MAALISKEGKLAGIAFKVCCSNTVGLGKGQLCEAVIPGWIPERRLMAVHAEKIIICGQEIIASKS